MREGRTSGDVVCAVNKPFAWPATSCRTAKWADPACLYSRLLVSWGVGELGWLRIAIKHLSVSDPLAPEGLIFTNRYQISS